MQLYHRVSFALCTLFALALFASGAANAERYRIELKAWIPSDYVVDPVPGLGRNNCYSEHGGDLSWWKCDSKFSGDGHVGYGGSYRVVSRVTFDWNGARVSNIRHQDLYGQTTRYHTLHKYPGLGGPERDSHSRRQDSRADYSRVNSSTIRLSYRSRNPHLDNLPLVDAPAIDAEVEFNLSSDTIYVTGRTDKFPSHGAAVYRYYDYDNVPRQYRWIRVDSCVLRDASNVDQWSRTALAYNLTHGGSRNCYLNWDG